MVWLTRIYTKTGDNGTSAIADGTRHPKDDLLFEAIGTVDEANASIGVAMSFIKDKQLWELLQKIQNSLFDLGADLATSKISIEESNIEFLEQQIDFYNQFLPPLNSFVLPSGTKESSLLHLTRTIVRRAERSVWSAVTHRDVNPLIAKYLNRLSDLLFVLARHANKGNDVLWKPQSPLV